MSHRMIDRVLIAEDNPDLADIFLRVFQSIAHAVDVARDGQEAIKFLNQGLPSVVVLDVNMPKVSGLDVLSYLRGLPKGDQVKVLMVTGNHLSQSSPEAQLADLFLVKPVDIQDLLLLTERLMR